MNKNPNVLLNTSLSISNGETGRMSIRIGLLAKICKLSSMSQYSNDVQVPQVQPHTNPQLDRLATQATTNGHMSHATTTDQW